MLFLGWNAVLSAWLLVSAFVLPHSWASMALTIVAAFLILLFAALAAWHPFIRYANAVIALVLATMAVSMTMPGSAAVHNGIFAAILFVLSLVSPLHATASKETAVPSS